MKKIIIILTSILSLSMADSVLLIKKGWQLVGSSTTLTDMSKFTKENVEEVWHFDATTQKWLGYSADETIQSKIDAQHIDKLKTLKSWHGFWLKSKKDWSLTFKDKTLSSEPTNRNASDTIELKKGWNLISLPVDSVVSAKIFKDMTVWKYNPQEQWELSDKSDSKESFPPLGHIKNSDGLWVKSEKNQNISVMKEASKLSNFSTQESMESYITEMMKISHRPYCGIEPLITDEMLTAVDNEVSTGQTSQTNLQEGDVDESDTIKHNSKYVFYIHREENKNEQIKISSFSKLIENNASGIESISFNDKRHIDSFYLVNNKLIVLSKLYPTYNNNSTKEISGNKTLIDIFNISDINNIKKIASYKIDGHFNNSRVVENRLYVISKFTPKYEISYPKIAMTPSDSCKEYLENMNNELLDYMPDAECYNIIKEDENYYRYDYDKPNIKIVDMLPEIEGDSFASKSLILPQRLYASAKEDQATNMTTISQFSLEDANYKQSTSYIGESSIEYASSKALYLLANNYPLFYDFNNYKKRSTIYKFKFDENLSYKATGTVNGNVLNQFSLSENRDILRVATTEGFSWGTSNTKNSIYNLKEQEELLEIEGILTGLGKEGETIKSVRFMRDRAYVVTFKNTDPLYTLDLSDPKEPKKVGELEVNGYSAYLHPVGEEKLLGIGRDSDAEGNLEGVKIELFDVSDFANPYSLDTIILAERTSSELEHNHKALAYRTSDNLFAFPHVQYINGVVDSLMQNNLGIYQIENNKLKSFETIAGEDDKVGEHRSLIFDLNNRTYISFFSEDSVVTKPLTQKEK